jgi:hypothetical protein
MAVQRADATARVSQFAQLMNQAVDICCEIRSRNIPWTTTGDMPPHNRGYRKSEPVPSSFTFRINHPAHEQNAAGLIVPNQEEKWVIGAKDDRILRKGQLSKSNHDARSSRCLGPFLVNLDKCLMCDL